MKCGSGSRQRYHTILQAVINSHLPSPIHLNYRTQQKQKVLCHFANYKARIGIRPIPIICDLTAAGASRPHSHHQCCGRPDSEGEGEDAGGNQGAPEANEKLGEKINALEIKTIQAMQWHSDIVEELEALGWLIRVLSGCYSERWLHPRCAGGETLLSSWLTISV